jgi:hypothetical protein
VTTLEIVRQNLLSPMALCFALGFAATFLKSDLRLPSGAYVVLSSYLMLAIGLKGGVALSQTSIGDLALPLVVTIVIGSLIPIAVYNIARRLGRLSRADSGAIAAHYGSVSAVTFIASLSFLDAIRVSYEGFLPALVAVMEIPGILVALVLARAREEAAAAALNATSDEFDPGPSTRTGLKEAVHEVLTGKSIVLLGGGVLVGAITGVQGYESVKPFFVAPFAGVLCLFMLEMGLLAAGRLREIKGAGAFLVAWGILGPIALGLIGAYFGTLSGLSVGGATVFATLCASASYIAAPAAVRIALPAANPSIYLTSAVGITFPFNLAVGIPLYYQFAGRFAG